MGHTVAMETMSAEWFTRSGQKFTGIALEANLAKGTAHYNYVPKCSRCGGRGGAEVWRFTGWTCYECGGSGKGHLKSVKLYTADKLSKLDASQAKRDAKRMAKIQTDTIRAKEEADAKRREFEATNAEFVALFLEWRTANPESTGFLADVYEKLEKYGSLSDKQMDAVRKSIERENERQRAREVSRHVGEIGKRIELILTCEKVIRFDFEDSRGYSFLPPTIYLCRDENGNRLVYKGTGDFPGEGKTARVLATVKEHGERNGELQTIVARPKVLAEVVPNA